jgi:hypothetical protein
MQKKAHQQQKKCEYLVSSKNYSRAANDGDTEMRDI